jgi:hypothetical protein
MAADRRAIDWLIDDLCENLGFSLVPGKREHLEQIGLHNIDAFTDAVLAIEGLDPKADKALRYQVRERIAKHAND